MTKPLWFYLVFIGIVFSQITVSPDTINASAEMGTSSYESLVFSNQSANDVTFAVTVIDQTLLLNPPSNNPALREANNSIIYIKHEELQKDIVFSDQNGDEIQGARCATPQPTFEEDIIVNDQIERWLETHEYDRNDRDQVNILVAFHVIHNSSGTGNVPDSQIEAQIQVLNDAYADYGIEFTLDIITRTENNSWFSNMDGLESTYKSALAVDPVHYFNIYTGQPTGGILGWAWLPSSWSENSYMHGVVLLYTTLPGGTGAPYNLGDTATHEAGHYLGLRHTFLNGCSNPGDYVDDTPFQNNGNNIYSCNNSLDTCPQEGTDPVHNFMNYTDDACLTEFTLLQGERMWAQINTYRPGLLENPTGVLWVSLPSDTLTFTANTSDTINVTLNAVDLDFGLYSANIILTDIANIEPETTIPVYFTVTATAQILVNIDTVQLGAEYVGYIDSLNISISNRGAASLTLSSFVVSDTILIYTGPSNITVTPFGTELLTVYFLSNSVGFYSGSFSFSTNDPSQPDIEIGITANVVEPPIVEVSTDTLFFSNISEPQNIIVTNNGQSNLLYSFSVSVDLVTTEIPVNDDFTSCDQPEGWSQVSSSGNGWQFGDQGGSTGFPIPDGNGCYAYINDDAQNVNGMSEILVMPELDLSWATSLFLFFSSYFSGGNDQIALVVASLDGGFTWQTVHEIDYHPNWHTSFINLNDFAGISNCLIGFYTSDNGSQGSGWAIDNIMVNGAFMQPWLTANPATGAILPGLSDTLSLTVIADNLEVGEYAGEIILHSNDPAESIVLIPITLDVEYLSVSNNSIIPDSYSLHQNYPNPFNPTTTIEYDIPFASDVQINIYDLTGAEVHSYSFNQLPPGRYKTQWNGTNNRGQSMSSGMYLYQIIVINENRISFISTKKMILMK